MELAAVVLGALTLESVLWWLVVGLLAGVLASFVMRGGGGYGIVGDIVVGLVGAFIGGFIADALGLAGAGNGFIWTVFIAFIGACILIALLRAVSSRGRRHV